MFSIIFTSISILLATLSGKIVDNNNEPVADAQVIIVELNQSAMTDAQGQFVFTNLESGNYTINVQMVGYKNYTTIVNLKNDKALTVQLLSDKLELEEVVVQSTNSDKRNANSYTNISAKELKAANLGMDLPILLNTTTSVVATSGAGAGVGYTGIRIRGTDANRINVTINGIPVNDAESHGAFWVNMPDLASSIQSLQIQRGVGTSSNGAAAFGGSINVQTSNLSKVPFAQISSSAGTFNTFKNTFQAGTGLINNKFAFETRLSKITSDGFIDRGASDLKSFFASGAYFGKKSVLKANVFSGKQKTYQTWNGVPEETLKAGNRTFNEFTYANQTDNYQQDHYHLIYTNELTPNINVNAALFYTYGRGYYEEYERGQSLDDYKIDSIFVSNDTITTTDLIRQKWLNNHFYGFTFSSNYTLSKLTATVGGGMNKYIGDHYGKVIWARSAGTSEIGDKYYDNDAEKNDANIYGKIFYQILPKLNIFTDLQWRFIDYSFLGVNQFAQPLNQTVYFNFFNPKAGFTWDIAKNLYYYASISVGQKEPTRGDFVIAAPNNRPKAEKLTNLETGVKGTLNNFGYSINYYLMQYKNQLVVTGQLDDVGNSVRINVPESYRTGIEIQGDYRFKTYLTAGLNLTLSQNKIAKYTQVVYDENFLPNEFVYNNSDIAYSPNVIFGGQINVMPVKGVIFSILPKYVGKQYLDNTSNETRKLNPYEVLDLRLSYSLAKKAFKDLTFTVQVNNVLNKKYESNGYTYTVLDGGKVLNSNVYYPQALRNILAGISMKF